MYLFIYDWSVPDGYFHHFDSFSNYDDDNIIVNIVYNADLFQNYKSIKIK